MSIIAAIMVFNPLMLATLSVIVMRSSFDVRMGIGRVLAVAGVLLVTRKA
jgi:uncharacterized membrane protein